MRKPIKVLLADDHAVLRAGLRALLGAEDDIEVVGEASSGEEAVEQAEKLKPDVIVMDVSMPGINGLEATRRIAGRRSSPRVLMLTMHPEEDYLLPVLEAGGSGYIRKTDADSDLTRAIRTVARDQVFLYPASAGMLLQRYRTKEHDPLAQLSEREREVLVMTAEGFSSREIGEKLFLSPKTVDTYRARLMEKLNLGHRSELVQFALENRLLRAKSSEDLESPRGAKIRR